MQRSFYSPTDGIQQVRRTGFPLNGFINVSSIIFAVNVLFPIIGIIYYGFISSSKKADILFVILFLLLTAFFCLAYRINTSHK